MIVLKNPKYLILLMLFALALTACGQIDSEKSNQHERIILGRASAEKELKTARTDQTQHNVIDTNTIIIKDKETAQQVIEPILYSVYGKNNIESQKPYESYLIDNHWVISGTLPKGMDGGTFLIIVDARNVEVLKLTHGK